MAGMPLASKGDLDDSTSGNEPLWRAQGPKEACTLLLTTYTATYLPGYSLLKPRYFTAQDLDRQGQAGVQRCVVLRCRRCGPERLTHDRQGPGGKSGPHTCLEPGAFCSAVPSARIGPSVAWVPTPLVCPTGQELVVRRHRLAREDQDRLGGQRALRGLEPAARRAHGPHQAQDPLRPHRVAARGGK